MPLTLEQIIVELGRLPDPNGEEYNKKLHSIFNDISKLGVIEQEGSLTILSKEICISLTNIKKLFKSWIKENEQRFSTASSSDSLPIIERMVMLTKGSGGFFDIDSMEYQTKDNFSLTNNKFCADGINPAAVASAMGCMTASEIGWKPTNEKFFTSQNGSKLVNSYKPRRIYDPKPYNIDSWLMLVAHICGDEADLVMKHLAHTILHPDQKIHWQILIHGSARTGKSLMFEILTWALGDAFKTMSNEQLLQGWDDAYVQTKAIKLEEIRGVRNTQFNELKTKFSNSDFEQLNPKGGNKITQQNLLSMYLLSNDSGCVKFDADQKKLLVVEAPHTAIFGTPSNAENWTSEEISFYAKLANDLKNDDFCNGILHFLQNLHVADWNKGALPRRTVAEYKMINKSKSHNVKTIENHIDENIGVISDNIFRIKKLYEEIKPSITNLRYFNSDLEIVMQTRGYKEVSCKTKTGEVKLYTNMLSFINSSKEANGLALSLLPTRIKTNIFSKFTF